MSKIYQKISGLAFGFVPLLALSLNSSAFADTMPDVYNFLQQDALVSLNIKTSGEDWPVLSLNQSLKKIDLLQGLKSGESDNPMNIILDPQVRNNLGKNMLLSLSGVDFTKDPQVTMILEMKNSSKTDFIKSKFNKMFLTKEAKLVEANFRGTKIYSYTAKDPKNTKYDPSFLAFYNNYVLITNNFNSIQDSMKTYTKEIPSISYSSDFVKSYDKLGSNNQMQLYLNMKKLEKLMSGIDKNGKVPKEMNLKMFKNLFANKTMLLNFQVNPHDIELKTYAVADKTSALYKSLQQSQPSNFKKYTAYIPKNALLFMGISDLKEAGHSLKELLAFVDTFNFESMFRESTGINLFDFADNLKNDMAIAAFNTESNPLIPGFALFMTPKDKGRMDLMFKAIKIDLEGLDKKPQKGNRKQREGEKPASGTEILQFNNTTTYKDITIYQTNELSGMAEFNARPAYAYLGEDVILASNEEAVKYIIDRSAVPADDFTLNGNSSYLKLQEAFGNQNNSIFFLNLSTIINMASTFLAGEKDSKEMVANLKKFEAIGTSSITDVDGTMGRMLILADMQNIDFNKLIPEDKKKKAVIKTTPKVAPKAPVKKK